MPEGDTIFRTAARLRPLIEGQRIRSARGRDREYQFEATSLVEQTVVGVEARGKHLLFHFEDGRALHSHMGMTGSWHVYRPGERWQKPERLAGIILEFADWVIVCFSPEMLELLSPTQLRRHPHLHHLGPDLLGPPLDPAEVLRRFRRRNHLPIGEAVMNQTIVCGIGNIYKSEVLFIMRTNPFVRISQMSDEQVLAIVDKGRELMMQNLTNFARTTRNALRGSRFWVYGRTGQPCFVCRNPIQVTRQGDLGRTTFWCTQCQQAHERKAGSFARDETPADPK